MGFVNQVTNAIGITDTEKSGSLLDQAVNIVSDPGKALNDVGTKVSNAVNDIGTAIDKTVPGGLPMAAALTAAYFGAPYLSEALGTTTAAEGTGAALGSGAVSTPVYSPSVVGTALPSLGAAGAGTAAATLAGLGGEYTGGLGTTGALTGGISDAAALQGEYLGGLGATGALTGGISNLYELQGEYDPTGFGDAYANAPEVPEGYTEADVDPSSPNYKFLPKTGLGSTISNFLSSPLVGNLTGGGALAGGAGLALLLNMLKSDQAKYGVPGRATYSGPLSQMRYNPAAYQAPTASAEMFRPRPGTGISVADQMRNPFMPRMPAYAQMNPFMAFAKGGSTKPQYKTKAQLAAMDPWSRAGAEYENAAYQAQMPVGPAAAPATNVPQLGQLQFNEGGHLGDYSDGGRLLRGPGDGVSDSIPATIANKQPARLANNEFVIPARIVSEIGNGSTDAGARALYAMMDRVQKRRGQTVGKGKVAVDSKARKELDKL